MNVSAILTAVYRRPAPLTPSLTERVRARLSLLETATELVRLLVSAPASAISESMPPGQTPDAPEARHD